VVVGLARSPASAQKLIDLGCRFVQGTITQEPAVRAAVQGCDAVVHLAADSRIGIRRAQRAAMEATNVRGTELLLDAAVDEGVARIVHVSTVAVFGNTRGQVVDETYRRPDRDYLSAYDETKHRAHELAERRIAGGAPVVIAQPGELYGPGDRSPLGDLLTRAAAGTLRRQLFPELGLVFVHVDDAVAGLLLTLDRAHVGEAYVLGGERSTLGEAVELAARVSGCAAPGGRPLPRALLRLAAPLGPLLAGLAGLPPNLREVIRAADGVTYWASDAKARRELGYSPRTLESGLRDLYGA
jgi:nucleoside-diphosphate-sugar epimerase